MDRWVSNGRLTSAAFHTRSKKNAKYVAVSLFLRERLPNHDGNALHVDRFVSWGRACLSVEHIRAVSRVINGVKQLEGFDLELTGSAEAPLERFGPAHANLVGPTHKAAAATALAEAFNQNGTLEREPA